MVVHSTLIDPHLHFPLGFVQTGAAATLAAASTNALLVEDPSNNIVFRINTSTNQILFGSTAAGFNFDITPPTSHANAFRVSTTSTYINLATSTGVLTFGDGTNDLAVRMGGQNALRLATLTTTERDALTAANGDLIFNSTTGNLEGYDGAWVNLGTTGGNTLDGAYDQGGAGAGATINVTDGPVVLAGVAGDNALSITGSASTTAISIDGNYTTGITTASPFTQTGGAHTFSGSNLDWDPTGTFDLAMDAAQTATITVADNLTSALLIQEGSNSYLSVDTNNTTERLVLMGNDVKRDVHIGTPTSIVDLDCNLFFNAGTGAAATQASISFDGSADDFVLTLNGGATYTLSSTAIVTSNDSTIIGAGTHTDASATSVQIGNNAKAATFGVAVGSAALADGGLGPVAIGINADAGGSRAIAVGNAASAAATESIAFGSGATINASHAYSQAYGRNADSTAANQLVFGSSGAAIYDVYFGEGVVRTSAPTGVTIHATGGSGTDIAGGSLTLAGGTGTGTALPGKLTLQVAHETTTGSTAQTLFDYLEADGADSVQRLTLMPQDVSRSVHIGTSGSTATINSSLVFNSGDGVARTGQILMDGVADELQFSVLGTKSLTLDDTGNLTLDQANALLTADFISIGGTGTSSVTDQLNVGTLATFDLDTNAAGDLDIGENNATRVVLHKERWHKTHSAFALSEERTRTGAVQTTNATPTNVISVPMVDDAGTWIEAHVIGRDTADTEYAYYIVRALITRAGAGNAAISGAASTTIVQETTGSMTAVVAVSTTNALVTVTGIAATTINWACTFRYQAVSGNT
jgi:hypothetical protein